MTDQGSIPRTCGGTRSAPAARRRRRGLSPHLRGNLTAGQRLEQGIGSIPALVGEPAWQAAGAGQSGVYPRTCGGTCLSRPRAPGCSGLSPHLRGNPPAEETRAFLVWGLSPHLRGNPQRNRERRQRDGSIPALAGEPTNADTRLEASWVYPRTCGGTMQDSPGTQMARGLSPHLRGNRLDAIHELLFVGSIPALAGEPLAVARGLFAAGSIPALAGEPAFRPVGAGP